MFSLLFGILLNLLLFGCASFSVLILPWKTDKFLLISMYTIDVLTLNSPIPFIEHLHFVSHFFFFICAQIWQMLFLSQKFLTIPTLMFFFTMLINFWLLKKPSHTSKHFIDFNYTLMNVSSYAAFAMIMNYKIST